MSSLISSQNATILAHLRTGNTITQLEAYNAFGCTRLSARIYDLRKRLESEGDKEAIDSVSIAFTARSGKSGRYCRYYLKRLVAPQKDQEPDHENKEDEADQLWAAQPSSYDPS
jgi:hypothetical protein